MKTKRRRDKQIAHNLEQGITPQGLNKKITDVMDLGGNADKRRRDKERVKAAAAGIRLPKYRDPKEIAQEITLQEKAMYAAAQNLEFEKAAKIRDQLHELREQLKTYG